VKNWIGQEIDVDTVVYRGGRQGDSSSFRLGVVKSVDTSKRAVRVEWKYVPCNISVWFGARQWDRDPRDYVAPSGAAKASTRPTTYPIDDLIAVSSDHLEYAEKRHMLAIAAREFKVAREDYAQFEQDFMNGLVPFNYTP
jgi:hypothetical protein